MSDLTVEQPVPVPGSFSVSTLFDHDAESDGLDFLTVWVDNDAETPHLECSVVYHDERPPAGPFPVAAWQGGMNCPAVAFREATAAPGACYMIVWIENHSGIQELWGRRARKDGSMIDDEPFFVVSLGGLGNRECGIASDGDRFLVVWNEIMTNGKVKAILLAADDEHTVTELPIVYDGAHYPKGIPGAAYDPVTQTYQAVWKLCELNQVWSRTLDRNGQPIPERPAFIVDANAMGSDRPRVASGGANFVAVWDAFHFDLNRHQAMWRGLADGTCATPIGYVCAQSGDQWVPDIAANGDKYTVVWYEADGIYADTVAFWQRHFYSDWHLATSPNSGRHIVLDPTTGWLHMVYVAWEDYARRVLYTYSTDGGVHWWPSEAIDLGTNPCVACEGQSGLVWVSYTYPWRPDPENRFAVYTAVRHGRLQWQTWPVAYDVTSPPSMAICHSGPATLPSVYVVYGDTMGDAHFVWMATVNLTSGPSQPEVVWGPEARAMWYPSVAVTPGDLVHVTWTRDCPPERVVSYRQRNTTGWGPLEEVTAFAPPAAKPAYHASVEAYGDRVYAVWKSMEAPGDMGEIWRAWRDLWDPTWWEASNLSQNPATASDYPQQSTHWACAWQDPVPSPDNEDIWGRIYEQTLPIHQDPLPSTYPNIAAEWSTIGEPPRLRLYSIWTSETPIQNPPFPFEVLFQRDDLFPPADGFDGFTYYDCGVGDSAKSPYCLARDGFARWRNHKVDFGHSNLRYRLPFLNPNYDYKLRAVLYQASRDTWQQAFVSDSVPLASVRHRPLVPETVWIDIPRESYAKDCEVTLDINKLAGQYAAVTELRLYECFPCNKGEGGMQGGQIAIVPSATRVGSPRPSLFRDFTNLSYTVAVPQRVNVEVYDIQGRKVRRLASGMCKRGTHFARWNGLDDLGRRAPAGAYVLRVESEGTSQTRKVVYMR